MSTNLNAEQIGFFHQYGYLVIRQGGWVGGERFRTLAWSTECEIGVRNGNWIVDLNAST